ncbi:unnamed protein product [Effrenium voratum]|nr:unnamed protein product [Effrenium voratum]
MACSGSLSQEEQEALRRIQAAQRGAEDRLQQAPAVCLGEVQQTWGQCVWDVLEGFEEGSHGNLGTQQAEATNAARDRDLSRA